MSDRDIYLTVSILSKTWTVSGFKAIQELAEWLDENASSFEGVPSPEDRPSPSLSPPPLNANGGRM